MCLRLVTTLVWPNWPAVAALGLVGTMWNGSVRRGQSLFHSRCQGH